MATIVAAAGGGNWTAGGTWVGGVAPTAADDVQFLATSGNVTIDTGAVCRSADFTGAGVSNYAGTLTHTAGVQWNIGDGTLGLSNIALTFTAGMTYTLGNSTTSSIRFASSVGQAAAAQSITWAGKVPGNLDFGNAGAGAVWQFADGYTAAATTLTFTKGVLDINGKTLSMSVFTSSNSNTRTLTLGAAQITLSFAGSAWAFTTVTNLTMTANTALITFSGASATMTSGGKNYNGMSVSFTGTLTATLPGTACTFANVSRIGNASAAEQMQTNANHTITGTFTVTGATAQFAVLVKSGTVGSTVTITAAVVALTDVHFQDVTGAGAASPFTGTRVGDCLGNSGITFTQAAGTANGFGGVFRYAVVAGNFSSTAMWSTTSGGAGGSSIPLPQDTVVLDANSAVGTYVTDCSRFARDVVCTGFTRTWNISGSSRIMYGNLTLGAAGTYGNVSSGTLTLSGRLSTHTITLNGSVFAFGSGSGVVEIDSFGGTYSLADPYTQTSGTLAVTRGTLDCAGFNVTTPTFTSTGNATRTVQMRGATWSLTNTGVTTVWNISGSGVTITGSLATIKITTTSANARTLALGAAIYGTIDYTLAGSTGGLVITGANLIGTLNFSDASNARTLTLPASTTNTILVWNVYGTPGNLMSIISSTPGTAATVSKGSGVVGLNYVSIKDSTATGGAAYYAGPNSTNVSGNTGWIFSAPPINYAFST